MDAISGAIADSSILGIIAILISVLGEVRGWWDLGLSRLWRRLIRKLARIYWNVAGQTLHVIPFNQHFLWWGMGTISGKPMMQVVGDFHFTNITTERALIVKTYFVAYSKKWKFLPLKTKVEGLVFVQHPQGNLHGNYEIMPRSTAEGRADWIIEPPVCPAGKALYGRACFIDRYGNEHWTEKLRWEHH